MTKHFSGRRQPPSATAHHGRPVGGAGLFAVAAAPAPAAQGSGGGSNDKPRRLTVFGTTDLHGIVPLGLLQGRRLPGSAGTTSAWRRPPRSSRRFEPRAGPGTASPSTPAATRSRAPPRVRAMVVRPIHPCRAPLLWAYRQEPRRLRRRCPLGNHEYNYAWPAAPGGPAQLPAPVGELGRLGRHQPVFRPYVIKTVTVPGSTNRSRWASSGTRVAGRAGSAAPGGARRAGPSGGRGGSRGRSPSRRGSRVCRRRPGR